MSEAGCVRGPSFFLLINRFSFLKYILVILFYLNNFLFFFRF